MFDDETHAFALRSTQGDDPLLEGVTAEARLEGPLFTVVLTQTWRHPGGSADAGADDPALEVVYSFPLPAQAVLLGLAADFGTHRVEAVVMPRRQAEATYEQALAEGDAPVLLESLGDGLYSACLGSLRPGETVRLELRFAQLAAFEQGRLRLVLPTTLAPRYGAAGEAGLQGPQAPAASVAAHHPLALGLTVCGALARGAVECPTHRHVRTMTGEGLRLELKPGAALDRDVVFVVTPAGPQAALLVATAPDGDGAVALAAMQLPPGRPRGPLALRLLLDASGSMAGDGIESAQRALLGVLGGLEAEDEVSFSRFGSTVEHEVMPAPLTPACRTRLRQGISAARADLGGTEMAAALQAVMALPAADARPVDVLLVTDGEIWGADELVAAALQGGHRVFAIGVGSAPAEGVLRRLAEATGGACEFATPGEALEAAALRMLRRLRHASWRELRVDWGRTPAWLAPLPAVVCGGDTLLAVAGFDGTGPGAAEVVVHASDGLAQVVGRLPGAQAATPVAGDALPRLAAHRRLPALDAEAAQALALRHGLLTAHTAAVLVHRRAEEDKDEGLPRTVAVPPMLAAGWGGTGTAALQSRSLRPVPMFSRSVPVVARESVAPSFPSVWRSARSGRAADIETSADAAETSVFFSDAPDAPHPEQPTLRDLMLRVRDHLAAGRPVQELDAAMDALPLEPQVEQALAVAESYCGDNGGDRASAWLLFALWVAGRPGAEGDRSAATLFMALRPAWSAVTLRRVHEAFDRLLGGCVSDGWHGSPSARRERLP